MDAPSVERQLSDFVVDLTYDAIPPDVVETVTRAFVDTVGVTIAGAVEGAGRVSYETIQGDPESASAAELLGIGSRLPPESVALQVGTAAHALDYDDLSWAMDGHPSVTLVPPVLALLGETTATGTDLITAYVAGFEVEAAVAEPISPGHYEAGWHATATFGTIGAAAAAASLLDLDVHQTEHALNAAASMVSGLKRNFGSMTKPLHAGLASRSGVTAARLALGGLTADARAISGPGGFWDLYGAPDHDAFEIGDGWALQDAGIHVKAFPSCYFTHTAIAGILELTQDLDPSEIELITVEASRGAADALQHEEPTTGLEAKFSMEYAVATAAVRDRVELDSFRDEAIENPVVQSVRETVEFVVDEDLPYDSHASTVHVQTADSEWTLESLNPPGTHGDPLSESALRAKFDECTAAVLGPQERDRVYELFDTLPKQPDVGSLLSSRP